MLNFAPVRVSYRYGIVISYRVSLKGPFVSVDAIVTPSDWMSKSTHALSVPDSRESHCMPERIL